MNKTDLAAVAAGGAAALGAIVFKAPLWASIALECVALVVTKKAIDAAAA